MMLPISIKTAAKILTDAKTLEDAMFNGVCINSGDITMGELFIALEIGQRDGHDFVEHAESRGAAACMVSKIVGSGPKIIVPDTVRGLWELGEICRDGFSGNVLALTGSFGKTSTRDFLGSILKIRSERNKCPLGVLVPQSNFNNHLGVPLTLTRLRPEHRDLVLELGANAVGEIDQLAKLTNPSVGAILNAKEAHMEGFGSAENIIKAKGEILPNIESQGIAILPAIDEGRNYWDSLLHDLHLITFGFETGDVCWSTLANRFTEISTAQGLFSVRLPVMGQHFNQNASCATAMALSVGATLEDCKIGLESAVLQKGRMSANFLSNSQLLIDDSYNASPESVRAAIDWLADQNGSRLLMLGGLSELGAFQQDIMETLGQYAFNKGIDRLITTGFGYSFTKGFGLKYAKHVPIDDLLSEITRWTSSADVILVKASRSEKLEQIVESLISSIGLS